MIGNRIFDEEECLDIDHHQNAQILLLERSKLRSTSSSLSSTADDTELTSRSFKILLLNIIVLIIVIDRYNFDHILHLQ